MDKLSIEAVKFGASLTSRFKLRDEGLIWNCGVGFVGIVKSSTQPPYQSVAGSIPIDSVISSSNVIDQEPLGETNPLILLEPLNEDVNDSQTN